MQLQAPVWTVRGWLRGVARGTARPTGAGAVMAAAGADVLPGWSSSGRPGGELAEILEVLGAAAPSRSPAASGWALAPADAA